MAKATNLNVKTIPSRSSTHVFFRASATAAANANVDLTMSQMGLAGGTEYKLIYASIRNDARPTYSDLLMVTTDATTLTVGETKLQPIDLGFVSWKPEFIFDPRSWNTLSPRVLTAQTSDILRGVIIIERVKPFQAVANVIRQGLEVFS